MITIDEQYRDVIVAALLHADMDLEHFWYKWKDGVRPSELRAHIKDALADLKQAQPASQENGNE